MGQWDAWRLMSSTKKHLLILLPLCALLTNCHPHSDPALPITIQFGSATQSIGEGVEINITLQLGTITTEEGAVKVTLAGNAVYTEDYNTTPSGNNGAFEVHFAKGASSALFSVATVQDDSFEGEKSVSFTLSDPSEGFTLGDQKTMEVKLVDDEAASIANFQMSAAPLAENATSGITIQIPFSASTKGPGTMKITFASNNAIYGNHFTTIPAAADHTISFSLPNNSSGTSLTIIPKDDSFFHTDYVIVFEITTTTGSLITGNNKTFTLTINEDEKPSLANFDSSTATVLENDAVGIPVKIPLSIAASETGSVTVTYVSANAIYGNHFVSVPAAAGNTITLPVAKDATQVEFTLFAKDDLVDNVNRVIAFKISATTGVVMSGTAIDFILTITDNEPSLRKILISFGRSAAPLVGGTETWNHAYSDSPGAGDRWDNLVRSDGVITSYNLVVNSHLTPQPLGKTTGINSGAFPDNALKEYWYVPGPLQGITRGFSIELVDNTIAYTIRILGGTTSVSTDGKNKMTITVNGETKSIEDVTNNASELLIWNNKSPQLSKLNIDLTDTDGAGICPINVMEITWYEQ